MHVSYVFVRNDKFRVEVLCRLSQKVPKVPIRVPSVTVNCSVPRAIGDPSSWLFLVSIQFLIFR
jgi:hypothetical protein